MEFGRPELLATFAVAALIALLGIGTLAWRARQVRRFQRGGGGAGPTSERRRDLLRLSLIVAAAGVLTFAAARPQFGETQVELEQRGVAVAIALDVSQSMTAQDQRPDRFSAAVGEISRYLAVRQDDLVGLVIFAGSSFVRFPLTEDRVAAERVLAALAPGELLVRPGSNLAAAIDGARTLLDGGEAATRIILLVTAGEELQGDALAAARSAADDGVRVFTAGVGTPDGAMIPAFDADGRNIGFKIDARTGQPVVSRLNVEALSALATAGGGRFVRLDRPGALSSLTADFAALEASLFETKRDAAPKERFQIFLAIAIGLLLLEPVAGGALGGARLLRRRSRTAAIAGVASLGLLAAACATQAFGLNGGANELVREGEHSAALEVYREAQELEPGNAALNLNAGRALHALEEFERAETETSRALRSEDPALRARALYNLALHRWANGDLIQAHSAFIEALRLEPNDLDAKINLELLTLQLQELLEPEPGEEDGQSGMPGEGGGEGEPGEPGEGEPGEGGGEPTDQEAPEGAQQGEGDQEPGQDGQPGQRDEPSGIPENPDALGPDFFDGQSSGGDSRAELQEALDQLEREATVEQALALLDALRERPRNQLSAGSEDATLLGDRDW